MKSYKSSSTLSWLDTERVWKTFSVVPPFLCKYFPTKYPFKETEMATDRVLISVPFGCPLHYNPRNLLFFYYVFFHRRLSVKIYILKLLTRIFPYGRFIPLSLRMTRECFRSTAPFFQEDRSTAAKLCVLWNVLKKLSLESQVILYLITYTEAYVWRGSKAPRSLYLGSSCSWMISFTLRPLYLRREEAPVPTVWEDG
jgi:hypothetical protein